LTFIGSIRFALPWLRGSPRFVIRDLWLSLELCRQFFGSSSFTKLLPYTFRCSPQSKLLTFCCLAFHFASLFSFQGAALRL